MGKFCCDSKADELEEFQKKHKSILYIVLWINVAMFFVEITFSIFSKSTALLADSLDMLGDSFVYAISLYAIGKSLRWNSSISMVKGIIMTLFGLGVFVDAINKIIHPVIPKYEFMGSIGFLALVANFICAALLLKHRNDNLNMRSTWLCSRNDVIANFGVIIAAGLVALTKNNYPDIVVGIFIAGIVLKSALSVLSESWRILHVK